MHKLSDKHDGVTAHNYIPAAGGPNRYSLIALLAFSWCYARLAASAATELEACLSAIWLMLLLL
jgi:hypothetical protein